MPKYATVLVVEGKFIVEVSAPDKQEAQQKVMQYAAAQDLDVKDQGELLPVRSAK